MSPQTSPQKGNEYIAALKRNGAGDQAVIAILQNAGWPEKEAVAALASHYQDLTGMAPPSRPRSIGRPREAFLHLLSFVTLGIWCMAAGSLWFILIEGWFPDPAGVVIPDPMAAMAWNLASVLVGFPVFLVVMRTVWRELLSQPTQADSAVRRWLTYVALLIATSILIGDLVVFVEHLLRGEISARFASKVLVVLVMAGGVFWFLVGSAQSGEDREARLRRFGRIGAAVAGGWVALTLALSFARFGTPAAQRLSASDDRRSEDLETIAKVIRNRWVAAGGQEAQSLPQSLRELPESTALRLADPISGKSYRYTPFGGGRYEVCAEFQTDTTRLPVQARRNLFRVHPAGNYCFRVDAVVSLP